MDPLAILGRRPLAMRQNERALAALQSVNNRVAGHGLTLTGAEMALLSRRRGELLQSSGRVEFGDGALPALAFTLCDSPHIAPADYAATLEELLACFYHYKNELENSVTDAELLDFMQAGFNGVCKGSVDHLANTLLEPLAQRIRLGQDPATALRGEEEQAEDGEEEDVYDQ